MNHAYLPACSRLPLQDPARRRLKERRWRRRWLWAARCWLRAVTPWSSAWPGTCPKSPLAPGRRNTAGTSKTQKEEHVQYVALQRTSLTSLWFGGGHRVEHKHRFWVSMLIPFYPGTSRKFFYLPQIAAKLFSPINNLYKRTRSQQGKHQAQL